MPCSFVEIDENLHYLYTPAIIHPTSGTTIIQFLPEGPELVEGREGSGIATDV